MWSPSLAHEVVNAEDATAELANIRRKLAHDNKEVVRAWEKREWGKAKARIDTGASLQRGEQQDLALASPQTTLRSKVEDDRTRAPQGP